VENTGNNFGRVLQTQLVYSKTKQEAPGFPIFPHSKRSLEVPLEEKVQGDNLPSGVTLQFQNFKVEEKVDIRNSALPSLATDVKNTEGSTGKNP
jgi:hypothetical protein